MKEYTTENIRNVAFLGHSGSGKSTFLEAMLFSRKQVERMGSTTDGTLASDYDPEESKRKMSINATVIPVETKTTKINVLDCPGSRDFIGDIKSAVHAAEGAIIFVDAHAGVEVGAEFAMEYAEEYGLPVAAMVNKLDKEDADFAACVAQISELFGKPAVPLALPVGKAAEFSGVVDLLHAKAVSENGGKATTGPIPEAMQADVDAAREAIVEAAAEGDDALMEKYFDEGTLSEEEVTTGLRRAFREGRFIPVLCGAAPQGVGVATLIDFLENEFPSPDKGAGLLLKDSEEKVKPDPSAPFSAFVYKTVSDDFAGRLTYFKVMGGEMTTATTVHNNTQDKTEKLSHLLVPRGKKQEEVDKLHAGDIGVVAKFTATQTNDTLAEPKNPVEYAPTLYPQRTTFIAIQARSSTDEDKVGMGLHALTEQDPTLELVRDPEIHQTHLQGMGEQHLDVALSRLTTKSKVEVDKVEPKIRYRETLTRKAEGQYRHKKQSGGRGQFAEVFLRLAPIADGDEDFAFKWSVFGGAIPTNFQSAIEKGAHLAMERGILAGYRAVGIEVDCYDGKHHPVDSSDMAFQIAASQAFRQIAQQAGPIILEPIDDVVTTVPEGNMGDVMGDVSQRRGKIQGSDAVGKKVVVRARVPQAEMLTYAQNLRSMTGGRGVFERQFSHYEPVPHEVQQKIVEKAQSEKQEEE